MKRKLFFIINSIFLIAVIGIGTQSCSDDDDDSPNMGKKTVDISVVDEKGAPSMADVTIWKNQDSITTVQVNGTYSYDVSNEASNTVFDFIARRTGYIPSGKKSVTLQYTDAKDTWSYAMKLTITKLTESFVFDQNEDGTINFDSNIDPSRKISMFLPAHATDLEYLQISPTLVATPASKGVFQLDAPNGAPSMIILNIISDWDKPFKDGKMATLTFPLKQAFISAVMKHGLSVHFGTKDNPTGVWESYPVTIDANAMTGTVSIPHFSEWFLTLGEPITMDVVQSPLLNLGTSDCGEPLTVSFTRPNPNVDPEYLALLGLENVGEVTESYTAPGVPDKQVSIFGNYEQANIVVQATGDTIVYYQPGVVFSTTTADCDHSGGGGQ